MSGLLIDRKLLLKHNLKRLIEIPGTPPKTQNKNDNIGIIFLIPEKEMNTLKGFHKKDQKISYLNSDSFINTIYASYYVVYNDDKKVCEIRNGVNHPTHLSKVLESISLYIPSDTTVWTGIIPLDECDNYINEGFDDPHVSDHSPLRHKFDSTGIVFSKKNSITKNVDIDTVKNKLDHALHQDSKRDEDNCGVYARFTKQCVDYLRKINKDIEVSGSLVANKVVNNEGKTVFELSPELGSNVSGSEEQVDAVWNRYNFHTHPKKAYDNHGVTRGWPSSQDFVGFTLLDDTTIFHTVVTLEGFYIISKSPEWDKSIKKTDKNYILNHYDIDHRKLISFEDFVDKINKKKYKKTGKQLFVVKYLSWENSTKMFPVHYGKTRDMCLVSENLFKLYK